MPSRLKSETTDAGEQTLVPGVTPVKERERLQERTEAPLSPKSNQKPCDQGLFNEAARAQIDIEDLL